ncbi:glycosyltransferase family 2 protein [Methanobrevibacter sp. TMH8]|uniref:glycosyltransferase family 2 protein n=1 Tax=Methanobrevibacter sp. TMH8 TaxID=2848611 RepID=UPI001CCCE37D|nr:glycosyltransferase family 2 protein [Methanobrevibacter sp. TMH8]MBZ9570510.1 glycosyltransferase family 2 protein [Methanobrevibacter sp. TMH8]
MKISVFINTLNEEENIKDCLETIKWADEIIIVDMYSEDKTVDIAKNYTDKIYYFERCGYADPARQFALEKCSNKWILLIDADMRVPLKLKNKFDEIMREDDADVVYVPLKYYYHGKLLHNYLVPDVNGIKYNYHLAFFKKDHITFNSKIHAFYNIIPNSKILKLKNFEFGLLHLDTHSFEKNLIKLDRYSQIEIENSLKNIKSIRSNVNIIYFFILFLKEFFLLNIYRKNSSMNLLFIIYQLHYHVLIKSKHEIYKEFDSLDFSKEIKTKYTDVSNEVISEYNYD